MDFVLALHTHLPYVLNHGRWPHGSDWLTEAVLDTYLPLLEALSTLEHEGTPTPVTMGITPVLANQLASPDLRTELAAFFKQRLEAADEAPASLTSTNDAHLIPLADFWKRRLTRLIRYYESIDGDMIGVFRGLAQRGRVELITSAATHGFLPMLAEDASIDLQLAVGRSEHERLFGATPSGIWLPECAYRPTGPWQPFDDSPGVTVRDGIERFLGDHGFRFFFADAHMARAGSPLGVYGEGSHGHLPAHVAMALTPGDARNSPYFAYRVSARNAPNAVAALVRDPRSSAQVWSRHGGYPGEQWYLEFHKTRWPGGLKFWRVSRAGSDLGDKAPYEPQIAFDRAVAHGHDFVELLTDVAERESSRGGPDGVIVAPFDTELFGHWWFEGPEFLTSMWRSLRDQKDIRAIPAGAHVRQSGLVKGLSLAPGSWGKNGDWSMWNGRDVAWTWPVIWHLEREFWSVAREAIAHEGAHHALAQAARSLLLTQSSDWQFIISTGEADDYAVKRFREHAHETLTLIEGLRHGMQTRSWTSITQFADHLARRDAIFPNVLDDVARIARG